MSNCKLHDLLTTCQYDQVFWIYRMNNYDQNIHHWFGGNPKDEIREIVRELKKLPAVQPDHVADVSKKVERTDETAQNVSDSDLVSRKAVTDALAKFVPYAICDESTESYVNGLTDAYNLILQLPPAQPERKQGRWIKEENRGQLYRCSACGNFLDFRGVNAGRGNANFCPNCGADMRKENES